MSQYLLRLLYTCSVDVMYRSSAASDFRAVRVCPRRATDRPTPAVWPPDPAACPILTKLVARAQWLGTYLRLCPRQGPAQGSLGDPTACVLLFIYLLSHSFIYLFINLCFCLFIYLFYLFIYLYVNSPKY